jgi:hypothetical protein
VNDEGPQAAAEQAARNADHVKRALAEAPPLSAEQRAKLIVLLEPVRKRRTQAAREAARRHKRSGAA